MITLSIVLVVCLYFGLFRNNWVMQTRSVWIWRQPKLNPDPWYVFSYYEMLLKYFWVWDREWFERRAAETQDCCREQK